jgi:DNA-binding PadR family transcriptional regulator
MPSRRPNTPFAILGMLRLAPMSGYDIRKESEQSIGHFWSESYGQIYPALRELRAQGFIRRHAGGRGGTGRDRQVYEITERGREALDAWRSEPPRTSPVRNELLLKLFFGQRGETAREIEWIQDRLEAERASLREFARIRKQLQRERRDHPALPHWLLTLSYGEHHARSVIRWCRESLASLRGVRKEHR